MHKKQNEAVNPFFFSSPQNKTRLLKEKDNEKSPAQQGSTLKRNKKKNHFNSIQGTGFFFFYPKKGNKLQSTQTNKQNKGQKTKTNMHSR